MGCKQSIYPKCIICFKKATTVLYPCGHFCLCSKCAKLLSKHDRYKTSIDPQSFHLNGVLCPFCRKASLPTVVYPNT